MDCKLKDMLSKRFITGLKKYNLTYEDILNNWFYIGGESGNHLIYFNNNYNEELPDHEQYCICGHKIKNNCFISDGENILSIGESCVNKFIPKQNKLCVTCGDIHRNRKDNKCLKCRNRFIKIKKNCLLEF